MADYAFFMMAVVVLVITGILLIGAHRHRLRIQAVPRPRCSCPCPCPCRTRHLRSDHSSRARVLNTGRTFELPHEDGTSWECLTTSYDYSTQVTRVYYTGTNSDIADLVEPFETGSTNFALVMATADEALSILGMSRLE